MALSHIRRPDALKYGAWCSRSFAKQAAVMPRKRVMVLSGKPWSYLAHLAFVQVVENSTIFVHSGIRVVWCFLPCISMARLCTKSS